jgi:hypothetical protein
MRILVSFEGEIQTLEVKPDELVDDVRKKIRGLLPNQSLIFNDIPLINGISINEYMIRDHCMIHVDNSSDVESSTRKQCSFCHKKFYPSKVEDVYCYTCRNQGEVKIDYVGGGRSAPLSPLAVSPASEPLKAKSCSTCTLSFYPSRREDTDCKECRDVKVHVPPHLCA